MKKILKKAVKKAASRKVRRPQGRNKAALNVESFHQQVLTAHGRKQVAGLVAKECKRLWNAEHAWIVMLPPDGSRPFLLDAPEKLQVPAILPMGLVSLVAETKINLLYQPRKAKPYSYYLENEKKLEVITDIAEMEERKHNDLSWLGRGYANSVLLMITLDTNQRNPRDQYKVATKVLVMKLKEWTTDALKKIDAFIPQARLAMAMTEQKKYLEKRLRQSAAISEIAQNINATMDLDILLRLIILEVTKAMKYQGGDIWLRSEKQEELIFHTSLGLSPEISGKLVVRESSEQALKTGDAIWIDQVAEDPRADNAQLKKEGMMSLAVVPLKNKNKVIGVMHFFAKQRRLFTPEERQLLKTLVNQAATAIDNARLFEETKRRAQELLALYEIAQVISEMSNVDSALEQIVERVSEVLNVEKSWFMFYDKEYNGLKAHTASVGIDEEQIAGMQLECATPAVSTQVFRTARPVFTNSAEQESLVQAEFKGVFNLRNLMAVPLRGQEETLGVFLVANKKDQSQFAGNDVRLFRTLASEATVIIQNANLYNKLKRSYHSIVQVISDMVDAREPYTLGHSERVASYAATIAKEMRLPVTEVERIRMAGLLHDIGKIGIAESILLKPGRLSDEEYAEMKRHSEIGVQILKNVEFPWEIRDLILYHHEHYNGRGYPAGLSGDAIPMGARIIAICDAFDVITSVRTYHGARTPWDAYRIIIKEKGQQFDPIAVEAFERVWAQLAEEIEARFKDAPSM